MSDSEQAIRVKKRLLHVLGNSDRRVKKLSSMHSWGIGPDKLYWTSCHTVLTVESDGTLILKIIGAPIDEQIERIIEALNGEIREVKRTGRSWDITLRISEDGSELEELIDAFDALPSKRLPGDNNHFFYEAPKAAEYLRRFRQILTLKIEESL